MTHALLCVQQSTTQPCTWFLWCACEAATPSNWLTAITAHPGSDPEGRAPCPLGDRHEHGGIVTTWTILARTANTVTLSPSIDASKIVDHPFHTSRPVTVPLYEDPA